MTDQRREDDEAEAWLLAREGGVPGPSVPEATAARYQRLQALIEELPEMPGDVDADASWQQGVFAALDGDGSGARSADGPGGVVIASPPTSQRRGSPGRRSLRWIALAAIVPVAVLIALYALRPPPRPDPVAFATLSVDVVRGPEPHRSDDPSVGDQLIVRGVVEGAGELRIYDEDGRERARCTEPAVDCVVEHQARRTTLRLILPLRTRGALRPVLFAAPLGGPSAGMDADVSAAGRVGISVTTHAPVVVR